MYVEGIGGATVQDKEEAAEAKWKRDFANADIVRRGTGLDTEFGVLGVPRTEGYRSRESKRSVTCTDSTHSKQQMGAILQNLSEHGATTQALTGKAMGELGAVLFCKASPAQVQTQWCSTYLRELCLCLPQSVICEPSALEPQLGCSDSHDVGVRKRGLARVYSDPLKRLRGGVTGDMLVMRNDALARIKIACESYGTIKTNVANTKKTNTLGGFVQHRACCGTHCATGGGTLGTHVQRHTLTAQ